MESNPDGLRNRLGYVKILTLVVGIVLIGFIGHSYYKDSRDEAFLSCAIICFIISFLWTVSIIVNVMPDSDLMKKLDLLYHIVAFVFYFFTVLFFTISLVKYSTGKNRTTHRLWERVIAFVLGVANTGLYGLGAWLMFRGA